MAFVARPRVYKTFFVVNSAEHELSLLTDMKIPRIVA